MIERLTNYKNYIAIVAIVFSLFNIYLISKGIYYQLLIPIAVLIGFVAITKPASIILLIGVSVPFSLNIADISSMKTIGLYLPTEPLLIGLTFLFFLSSIVSQKVDSSFMRHRVSKAIMFMLFWLLVTSLTSTMPVVSFKFLVSRIWFVIPLYFMVGQLFKSKEYIRKFFLLYVISLAVIIVITLIRHSMYGFTQQSGHWVMNPFYKDHTSYGAVIALLFPLLVGYTFSKYKLFITKSNLITLLIILSVGLVFSYTRAAWLSLILGLGVYGLMKLRIKFYWVLTVVAVLGSSIYLFQDDISIALSKNRQDSSENFMEHIRSMTNVSTDASNLERLNRWNSAISMFEKKPLFGWGPGTYMFQYAPFQKSKDRTIISTNLGNAGNAHSEYIGPLAESGVFGLLYFLLIIATVLYTGIKLYFRVEDKELKMIVMASVVGVVSYAAHGFLNNFLDTDKLSYPFWGLCAVIVAIDVFHKKSLATTDTDAEYS